MILKQNWPKNGKIVRYNAPLISIEWCWQNISREGGEGGVLYEPKMLGSRKYEGDYSKESLKSREPLILYALLLRQARTRGFRGFKGFERTPFEDQ